MISARTVGIRYQIEGPPIGQGGMGVVYKAFDDITKRFVAVKTLRDDVDPSSSDLFQREWSVLAQLSHPNIVDVLDIGDFVENGKHRPYFVMPLLPGTTLDALMKRREPQLTPERGIEIICQACRGLQAAHSRGIIHRDLKPSNLFVMDDDTVKIIDFGVVHLVDAESRTCVKGTLQYMAPEQLEMKPASARSDIFSLGVVCYEALTGRKPFEGSTVQEVIDSIRSYIPPPISQLNPAVNDQVSRAVNKAMAKQQYYRFTTAREFSEMLQRAVRNEDTEPLDRSKIQPRINRAKKALNEGDFQLATDILDELESEGIFEPEMSALRVKTEQATRLRTIQQLIESAWMRMEEQDYPLALQNVQRVLDLDPANADALAMRREIDRQRNAGPPAMLQQEKQQSYYTGYTGRNGPSNSAIIGTASKLERTIPPARELVVRRPLAGEADNALLLPVRSRRRARSEDDIVSSGFSFQTKLLAMAALLILGGAGLFFSFGGGNHNNSPQHVWLPVSPQLHEGADASRRTSAAKTTRNEDSPESMSENQPPSLPDKVAQSEIVAAPVSFHFGSVPARARVVVDNDDRRSCLTPCELPLKQGRHTFLMSALGYNPVQRIVQVPESTTSFEFLTEGLKTVRLNSIPSGAELSVDGEPRGRTPTTLPLAVGKHKIRIVKDEVATEETINVTPDDLVFHIVLNNTGQ
ncbi:MAG TPA: protein kinase [Bryobacteraceae bacterium]